MHILPLEAYTSQKWFDIEQEKIFSNTWAYAGLQEDITQPGQYITVQAGLNNIFIIMDDKGNLRAFHNICQHRGTQLIRAVGQTQKVLTCPYHDWTYDLQGNLITVPSEAEEFKNIDKSCHGLKPASVGIWRGMLFVHPAHNATPVEEWFSKIQPHLGPHNVDELVEYEDARTSYEIKANWKIVVENYIDVYHLSHLHSGTLNMYNHAKAEFGFIGPHYAFYEPLSEEYAKDIEKNSPMPLIMDKDQAGAYVPMLFPGIGLAESESSWATFIITPLAPDLTRVENRVKVKNTSNWEFTKQEWRSASFWKANIKPKYEGDAEQDPIASADFTAEDIYACEQQQKSFKSPYFEIGPSGKKGEGPVREHQQVVLDFIAGKYGSTSGDNKGTKPKQSKAVNSVDATASIELEGNSHIVDIPANISVLQAAKSSGLKPPFSCQAGVCGKCKAKLNKGKVHMNNPAALTDKQIADGYILTCQAQALTKQLDITYE